MCMYIYIYIYIYKIITFRVSETNTKIFKCMNIIYNLHLFKTFKIVPSLTLNSSCSKTVLRSKPWDEDTALHILSSEGRCFCFFTFLMASKIHSVYSGLASFTMVKDSVYP